MCDTVLMDRHITGHINSQALQTHDVRFKCKMVKYVETAILLIEQKTYAFPTVGNISIDLSYKYNVNSLFKIWGGGERKKGFPFTVDMKCCKSAKKILIKVYIKIYFFLHL